jgi:hypothetical protein
MPDKANPAVPVRLGGKTCDLKCTLGAVHEFQEISGLDIYQDGLDVLQLHADNFKKLVWCCLAPGERRPFSLKAVNRLVNKKTVLTILPFVRMALGLSWPEPEKTPGKDEEQPGKTPTDWPGLWVFGRRSLQLGEEDFWGLTLAQFLALLKRWDMEQETLDYRTAVIASHILNTIPRTEETKDKVFTPADIFPHYGWGADTGEPDEDDIRNHFRQWALTADAHIVEN